MSVAAVGAAPAHETKSNFQGNSVLKETMRSNGIGTQVHYIPVSLHPYYKRKSSSSWILPNAYNYYDEALSIPCFYSLSIDQQMFVCETINGFAA